MFNSVFVDILSDWIREYQSSSSRPFSECQTRYRYAGSDLQLFLVAAELTVYGNLPIWLHVIYFCGLQDSLLRGDPNQLIVFEAKPLAG